MNETKKTKTNARQRQAVITINYHYTSAGRRPGLRKDIAHSVMRAIVRRLERHGSITVDSVHITEEDATVELGA